MGIAPDFGWLGMAVRLTQAQRRARTRERLFKATLEVVADGGFQALSTRRVASAAGMTMGAIYAHFEGRDDLVRGAMEYYRAHVPDLDVSGALSVGELLRGRIHTLYAMADSADETLRTINRFQRELARMGESDPAVQAL